jgi:ferritin
MKTTNNGAVGPAQNGGLVHPITLSEAIVSMLNKRIGDEYAAHYFYNAAANWCNNVGYKTAAAFFTAEADSELGHARGVQKYLIDWNALPQIPKVETFYDFGNLPEIIDAAYKLELDLFNKYIKDSQSIFAVDLATFDFLKEYRDIQTTSVAEYSDMLNALALIDINDRLSLLEFEETYLGA